MLLCEGMKWAHLPSAGGIYDQHPLLLDEWSILFSMKADHDRAEHSRAEREASHPDQPRIR